MSKENEPLYKIQEAIKEQEKIVNNKKSGEEGGVISQNPKATLAITAVIFAVLVIGMIAAFGGVGMIDGAMLGKVLLTGATVGTALYGGYKVFKAIKGDKDKKNLANLMKARQGIQRSEARVKLQSAQEALAQKLQLENDNHLVKRLLSGSEYEADKVKYKDANGKEQTQIIADLTPQQKDLYETGKAKKETIELKKQLEKAIKDLSETQIQTADTELQTLMTKLGVTGFDTNKKDEISSKIDNAADNVKKSDGGTLDASGSDTNKNSLKQILQACAGVGSDGNKIGADKTNYLDGQSRSAILKSLNEALDGATPPKFKANEVTGGKNIDVSVRLTEIQNKIATEKEQTKARVEKRNDQGKGVSV